MMVATKVYIFKHLVFLTLLAISALCANAQDYDKGEAAYKAGNYKTAFEELLPLAEGDDAWAQYFVGSMYEHGKGVIQNDAEAAKWYRLAADQGNAFGQFNLGFMYEDGRGVIQNDVEAVKWYRLSADQGNAFAQNNIGLMYEYGNGVIQSNVMAHMWYNISSTSGYEDAPTWRDEISRKMTREDISKAQSMAQECVSSGYKNCGD